MTGSAASSVIVESFGGAPTGIALLLAGGTDHLFTGMSFSTGLFAGTTGVLLTGTGGSATFDTCHIDGGFAVDLVGAQGSPVHRMTFNNCDLEGVDYALRAVIADSLLIADSSRLVCPNIGVELIACTHVSIDESTVIASHVGVRADATCEDVVVSEGIVTVAPAAGIPAPLGGVMLLGAHCAVREMRKITYSEEPGMGGNSILCTGLEAVVHDNHVRHASSGPTGEAVRVTGEFASVSDNHVEDIGAAAPPLPCSLRIGDAQLPGSGRGCSVHGNVVNALALGGSPGILIDATSVACTGNNVRVAANPSPGIVLSAASGACTAVGNTVIGSAPGLAVADGGLGNQVLLNTSA